MRIAVVGTGYVGLVAGTCFAETGHSVTCVDVDEAKLAALRAGKTPIYEPGLEELLARNVKAERVFFTDDLRSAVRGAEVVFIAVGTPQGDDGNADLRNVMRVAHDIAAAAERYTVIVNKSTVPVGTAQRMQAELRGKGKAPTDVVSNPEFLKEGAAIDDFMRPDRIVIGASSEKARALVAELYAPFVRTESPIYFMDPASAELTKYAANAMLAQKAKVHFSAQGGARGKKIAVWGLAFKPKTDDIRCAPAFAIIEELLADGAEIAVHDPVAMEASKKQLDGRVRFAANPYDAVEGAEALFLVTEWNEFRQPDFARVKELMAKPVVFDGRNIWNPQRLRDMGFAYYGVGRAAKKKLSGSEDRRQMSRHIATTRRKHGGHR